MAGPAYFGPAYFGASYFGGAGVSGPPPFVGVPKIFRTIHATARRIGASPATDSRERIGPADVAVTLDRIGPPLQ